MDEPGSAELTNIHGGSAMHDHQMNGPHEPLAGMEPMHVRENQSSSNGNADQPTNQG
jgi:hypothetical protein